MGDETKKPKLEDHTVEVSTDDLRLLRESAQHMALSRATLAEREATRPQLRSLSARAPHTPVGGVPAPDLRDVLKQASRLAAERGDEGGATKAIKRDNLVELLKGELREANAEEAPNSGILRHTRAKGDTPQNLLALGRGQDDPTAVQGAAGQKTRTDLEEIARALNKIDDEDPSEATRQVAVIPELRAQRPTSHPPARQTTTRHDQDPTLAADPASSSALAALSKARRSDEGETHEGSSMPELLERARDEGDALSPRAVADDPSEYSLEEVAPPLDRAADAPDEDPAASLTLRAPAADSAPARPLADAEAISSRAAAPAPESAAPSEPTPAPVVTSAVAPEVQQWLDVPMEAKMSEEKAVQREGGDVANAGEKPMLGRVLVFGAGASVAVMGLGLAFSDALDESMWGLIIAGVGMLVMGLALLFLRSSD
jgi:hypothetical protein